MLKSLCLCNNVLSYLCVSVCVSVGVCLSLSLSLCLSLSPSVPLCLSASLCVCLSVSVSFSLSMSLCLCLCLSVCLSVSVPPPPPPSLSLSQSPTELTVWWRTRPLWFMFRLFRFVRWGTMASVRKWLAAAPLHLHHRGVVHVHVQPVFSHPDPDSPGNMKTCFFFSLSLSLFLPSSSSSFPSSPGQN